MAIALVAQASGFGPEARLFAIAILPLVLFVGLTTHFRLGASNYHDRLCVIGMNRIRAAYLQLVPDVGPFLVMSAHDDPRGIGITMGVDPGRPSVLHLLGGTPTVVMVLNSVLAGVILALVAFQVGGGGGLPRCRRHRIRARVGRPRGVRAAFDQANDHRDTAVLPEPQPDSMTTMWSSCVGVEHPFPARGTEVPPAPALRVMA